MDGNTLVYCEGYFNTPWGKTAHGLVRFTRRYNIVGVIDSRYAGKDAGQVLDREPKGIPVSAALEEALETARAAGKPATHYVFGIAPDGGVITEDMRAAILAAIRAGLHVDCGMHYFISEDPEMAEEARSRGLTLRDVRKTPPRHELHPFTGGIWSVGAFRIAVLGTDSSVGKRTAAWKLVDALIARGHKTAFIGTGQTAWLQGARYVVIMDALINDFVAGEIENAVISAWKEEQPEIMVIEGQGSLMNPIFPGGFEILSAGQPQAVLLQHAPRRRDYDGLPGTAIHPLETQIKAIELLSEKPVIGITVNHEDMQYDEIPAECRRLEEETGLPARDALTQDLDPIVDKIEAMLKSQKGRS
jgi:uncharacterized NAD-dependent epimerase/dehydratase family protein